MRFPTALLLFGLLVLTVPACGGGGADDGSDTSDTGDPDAATDGGRDIFVAGDGAGEDAGIGDVVADTAGDASADVDAGPPPPSGYPSTAVVLRIATPSAIGSAASGGGVVPVRGVLFGRVDSLRWESDAGDSGTLTPDPFWSIPGVALDIGDNVITLTAEGPDGATSDSIVVTYNPSFEFGGPPALTPPALFAGEPTDVRITLPVGRARNFDPESVALHRVDAQLQSVARIADLRDDGDANGRGDDVEGDGYFTGRARLVCDPSQPLVVRAALQATGSSGPYRAVSAFIEIPCVARVSRARCEAVRTLASGAREAWEAALALDDAAAAAAASTWLDEQPDVAATGSNASGAWLYTTDGLLGAAHLAAPGWRGGGSGSDAEPPPARRQAALTATSSVGSRRTLLLDPWGKAGQLPDEIAALASLLEDEDCPGFAVEGPHHDRAATLARLRDLRGHGVIALAAAGGAHFGTLGPSHRAALGWTHLGPHPIVWTGEEIDCDALLTAPVTCNLDSDCPGDLACLRTRPGEGACYDVRQVDLALGRIAIGPDTWGALPAFFDAHAGPLPDSVVYLGACGSLEAGGLAAALFAAGARVVYGWSGPVTSTVATEHGAALFDALLSSRSASEALPADAVDPETGAALLLFGAPDVDVSPLGVLDAGFESGELHGWDTDGDVRVFERLGGIGPLEGSRFAAVSTGLGLDRRNGALRQTFCVPADSHTLSFWWRAVTEEIPLNCGSVNQDRFLAVIRGPQAQMTAVDVTVDDLCAPAACPGCGNDYAHLAPADIALDQGAAVQTEWREARFDLGPFTGRGPVVLELTVSDKGDSSFDTVVLLDDFRLY